MLPSPPKPEVDTACVPSGLIVMFPIWLVVVVTVFTTSSVAVLMTDIVAASLLST